MKKRLILITSIFLTILALIGCVKKIEKVTTVLSGRVIEESQSMPLNNVNVVVTNGNQEYASIHTGVTGTFKLNVTFDDLNDSYYLYLDDGNHNKRLDLKGAGRALYDYKDIALYKDNGGNVTTPSVTTSFPTSITTTSAICGGNVTSDGGATVTKRGICYSTSQNPQLTNASSVEASNGGTGSFTCNLIGLSPNTTYYVKAYAINSAGTAYGSQKSFKTNSGGGSNITEFSEGFESGIPSEWETIDADGDGNNWKRASVGMSGYNITPHSGSDFVYSESYNSTSGALTPDNYLVSPLVSIGSSSTFSFWAAAQDASWASEHFGVAVSTTSQTSASAFTTIMEWTMTAKTTSKSSRGTNEMGTYHKYTVNLSAYAGQYIYIAIRHFNCTDMFYLDVDDVELSTSGGSGGQTYSYTFESNWENWTTIDADGDGNAWGRFYSSDGNIGHNNSVYIMGSKSWDNGTILYPDNYLISPQRYTMSTSARISFYVCAHDANYPAEHYGVAISTASTPSASSFTTIWEETLSAKIGKSENNTRGNRDQGTWYLKTIDLSSYSGQTIWIAIRHFDCSDQFILDIDDITIVTGN